MAWYPEEKSTVLTGALMPNAGVFTYDRFPLMGQGITKIRLIFCATITAGGTVPITLGGYNWLKGITLRNNRDEYYFRSVPGLALYRASNAFDKATPHHDVIVAGAGVFVFVLDLPVTYPFLNRLEDTIIETKRINNLTLEIATGDINDFQDTPAAATVAVTATIEVISTRASIGVTKDGVPDPARAQAYFHSYMRTYPMLHTELQAFWDLEAAPDLALLGFLLFNHAASGIPWLGPTAAYAGADTITSVSLFDVGHQYLTNILLPSFQHERNLCPSFNDFNRHAADAASPYTRVGEYWHSFVKNGSINEGYATKLVPRLSFIIGPAGTEEADLLVWGVRMLRD